MALILMIILYLATSANGQGCVCDKPTCLHTEIKSNSFVKAIAGGVTMVGSGLVGDRTETSAKGAAVSVAGGSPPRDEWLADDVGGCVKEPLRGTNYEVCKWTLVGQSPTTNTTTSMQFPQASGRCEAGWQLVEGNDPISRCYDAPKVFRCGGKTFISPNGCPPVGCTSGTVYAIQLGDCAFGYMISGKRDTGIVTSATCITSDGFFDGSEVIREKMPSNIYRGCSALRRRRRLRNSGGFAVVPAHLDVLGKKSTLEYVGDGWHEMRSQSNDLEAFIRCCGFTLGVGGALWQYHLNTQGVDDGSVSAKEVQEEFQKLVGEINRRVDILSEEIEANRKQIVILRNVEAETVEDLTELVAELNISSLYSDRLVSRVEEQLGELGYCRKLGTKHCWCPPKSEPVTPPAPIATVTFHPLTSTTSQIVQIAVLALVVITVIVIGLVLMKTLLKR